MKAREWMNDTNLPTPLHPLASVLTSPSVGIHPGTGTEVNNFAESIDSLKFMILLLDFDSSCVVFYSNL